jgi:hypothetical protein
MLKFFGTRLPLKIYAYHIPGTYFVINFVIIWCLSFFTVSRCYPFSYLELDVIIFGFILCYHLVVIIFHCQQMLSFFLSSRFFSFLLSFDVIIFDVFFFHSQQMLSFFLLFVGLLSFDVIIFQSP